MLSTSFLRWMPVWVMNNIKILYCDRIEVCEETDINKTSESKESKIYHYWNFSNKGLKF